VQCCRSGDNDENGDHLREDHPDRCVGANRSYLRAFDSACTVAGIVGEAIGDVVLDLFPGLPEEQIRRDGRAQESHNGKNIFWT
jgi:hypothetical protein